MCHPYPGGLLAELGQEVVVEHAHTRSEATQDVEQVGLRRGGVRAHVGRAEEGRGQSACGEG